MGQISKFYNWCSAQSSGLRPRLQRYVRKWDLLGTKFICQSAEAQGIEDHQDAGTHHQERCQDRSELAAGCKVQRDRLVSESASQVELDGAADSGRHRKDPSQIAKTIFRQDQIGRFPGKVGGAAHRDGEGGRGEGKGGTMGSMNLNLNLH